MLLLILCHSSAKPCAHLLPGPSGRPAARPVGVAGGIGRPSMDLCARHRLKSVRPIAWKKPSVTYPASLIRTSTEDQVGTI